MESPVCNILVFKTNLHHPTDQQRAGALLDELPDLHRWTLDGEDVDCVLRIESIGLKADHVIEHLATAGFVCAELPD